MQLLEKYHLSEADDPALENFRFDGGAELTQYINSDAKSKNYFWLENNTDIRSADDLQAAIMIKDPQGNDVEATLHSEHRIDESITENSEEKDEKYIFTIDFGDRTQLSLRMTGQAKTHEQQPPDTLYQKDGSYYSESVKSEVVIINWNDPVILKGGVEV